MTLGEIILRYRTEHRLSQREFAKLCGGVTGGYISMVEQGKNPTTGKTIAPSLEKLQIFARGMGMSLQRLLELADDMPVDMKSRARSTYDEDDPWQEREALRDDPDRRALLDLARNGSAEDVRQVAAIIDALRKTNPDFYDGDES